jgi:hypothetical protein
MIGLQVCKGNAIPILMYQIRISTIRVSSVMLWPKSLEVRIKF